MNNNRRCTQEEIKQIIEEYKTNNSITYLANKYNHAPSTIMLKLKEAGIYEPRSYNFSDKDFKFIEEKYIVRDYDSIFEKYPRLSKDSLYHLMCKRKIKQNDIWSDEDIEILKSNYCILSSDEILKKLPNHTIGSIRSKANKLGLFKRYKWDDNEIAIMIENYNKYPVNKICEMLPNRTRDSIISQAIKLGLRNCSNIQAEKINSLKSNYKNMTDKELSMILDCSPRTALSLRMRYGYYKNNYERECCSYLLDYVRENNKEWKIRSMENCNYRCVVTGENFNDIHHIHGFNLIVFEALQEIDIDLNKNYNEYSENELKMFLNKVLEVQDRYPLGVCLASEIHSGFHKKYGFGNNTEEQWNLYLKDLKVA